MEDVAACFRRCSGLLLESWSGWKAPFWPARASLRWPAGELQPSLAQDLQQKGRGVSLVLQWGSAGRMSPQRGLCPADAHLLPQTDTSALSQAVPHLSWSQASFARACPWFPPEGWRAARGRFPIPLCPAADTAGAEPLHSCLLRDLAASAPPAAVTGTAVETTKPAQTLQREQVPGAVGLNRQDPGGPLRDGSECRARRRAVDTETPTQETGKEETKVTVHPGVGV